MGRIRAVKTGRALVRPQVLFLVEMGCGMRMSGLGVNDGRLGSVQLVVIEHLDRRAEQQQERHHRAGGRQSMFARGSPSLHHAHSIRSSLCGTVSEAESITVTASALTAPPSYILTGCAV